jgi:hypothetical protein
MEHDELIQEIQSKKETVTTLVEELLASTEA